MSKTAREAWTHESASPKSSRALRSNPGTGFHNTLAVLVTFRSRYRSLADLIAIGAITAVETWRWRPTNFIPRRPYRFRQTQHTWRSRAATRFAIQGFTQTEMIGLIACGHTFGGVQHKPFPQIVPDLSDPKSTQSVAHFDSMFVHFDNNVAKEYIAGTTQNPLVVGHDHTTRSDKRIFNSDANSTMQSCAAMSLPSP
ncbi:hypothetical protein B0H19DRAFT_1249251 [Mycena capillaripes]|nr:hypothetical protein B0H19DRAFT_1249251 [Mycena capillaripes]